MRLIRKPKSNLTQRERILERLSGKTIIYSLPMGLIVGLLWGLSNAVILFLTMVGIAVIFAIMSIFIEDDIYFY